MTTAEWLAQPERTVECDGNRITFKPIYSHPHLGWMITSIVPKCPDCGNFTVTTHGDGSQTCGHCYMQRARDLGVIPPLRKRTKLAYCARHEAWFAGETRRRQAECSVEGGPAHAERCEGGRCEMRPGTDFFAADFVESTPTATPAAMGWPNAS